MSNPAIVVAAEKGGTLSAYDSAIKGGLETALERASTKGHGRLYVGTMMHDLA